MIVVLQLQKAHVCYILTLPSMNVLTDNCLTHHLEDLFDTKWHVIPALLCRYLAKWVILDVLAHVTVLIIVVVIVRRRCVTLS